MKEEEEYRKHERILAKHGIPLWKTLIMIAGGGVTAGLIAYTIVGRWIIAGFAALAGLIVPRLWYGWHMKSQSRLVSSQMEQAAEIMASILRSGGSIVQALERAGHDVGDPVRKELTYAASEIRLGKSVSEVFTGLAERIKIPEMLILNIGVDLQSTGMAINLPSMLMQVQKNIRDRMLAEQDINTITAENKMAAYVVAAIVFCVVGMMRLVAPSFIAPLFNTTLGLIGFSICSVVIFIGLYWINNMVDSLKTK